MVEKQLNVWIDANLKEALADRAQREKTSLKQVTEAILCQEVARRNGEHIEQQALPLIRAMIATEVPKAASVELQSKWSPESLASSGSSEECFSAEDIEEIISGVTNRARPRRRLVCLHSHLAERGIAAKGDHLESTLTQLLRPAKRTGDTKEILYD
jgi:hypothetical protein